ncbi:MAG: NAD-dependent epimerase/dehydratase family protein [Crocinitomicaceae bacterium]|nr:NAD-dependent epimerase/dehydratase family protein [Crocinitomicaceae bacterium]
MGNSNNIQIVVTGGAGSLGIKLIAQLLKHYPKGGIHCLDVGESSIQNPRLTSHRLDIRSSKVLTIMKEIQPQIVFHLVGIMSNKEMTEAEIYDIEINGLHNALQASLAAGINHFIFVSSGSVYGYKAGLPRYIPESQALENDHIITYAKNKVAAEGVASKFCTKHMLNLTIFRPCSILGKNCNNVISRWFDRDIIIGLKDTMIPFSFVWDEDLVQCMIESVEREIFGSYNVAAEGWVTMEEIAEIQSKRFITLNQKVLGRIIGLLNRLSITEYKREHLDFIKYRPVLNRNKLDRIFAYKFQKTSRETFEYFLKWHGMPVENTQ